jgi:hypothetical protein
MPVWQAVQDRLAMNGEYMAAAIVAAKTLGVTTERGISITYDTAVQQGPGAVKQIARQTARGLEGQTVPARQLLERFIHRAAAGFRATSQPPRHPRAPRLEWRPVGNEWHVFAKQVDLYSDIIRRRTGLLNAKNLADVPVKV